LASYSWSNSSRRSNQEAFIGFDSFGSVLDCRLTNAFKVFVATEYKGYNARGYEGASPAPVAFSGPFATTGI
jgi:hypothetical protein